MNVSFLALSKTDYSSERAINWNPKITNGDLVRYFCADKIYLTLFAF